MWLKLILNWPSSFFIWDILFLIPIPWIGPVLAPVICSLTMILLSGSVIHYQRRDSAFKIKIREWSLIVSGALIILATFMWDYSVMVIKEGPISRFWSLANNDHFLQIMTNYNPIHFNWLILVIGELVVLSAIALIGRAHV